MVSFLLSLWAAQYIFTVVPEPLIIDGIVSAYNAEHAQTDSSPEIMASNKKVYEGAVANNCLKFGDEVKILGKIYVVEDRMARRYDCRHFDLFMFDKKSAINFGRQNLPVQVF